LAKVYPDGQNSQIANAPIYGPMRISPDQQLLALPIYTIPINQRGTLLGDGLVELWKIRFTERTKNTGPEFSHHRTIRIPDSIISGMDFSKDCQTLITATNDLSIHLWNPEDGSLIREFAADEGLPKELKDDAVVGAPNHLGRSYTVDISPDGKTLAVAFSRIVRLYDLEKNRWISYHRLPNGFGHQNLVFHPSGHWLVSTTPTKLVLWSLRGLEPRLCVEVPKPDISRHNVVFSPDGKSMVTGGYEPLRWSFDQLLEAANSPARRNFSLP
ncbi:MAG: hypothetical protein KDA84_00090, partial [Planctomycetaceae bacterium]|nr:hypothetical protein [Planctomycetaceae bacterium]